MKNARFIPLISVLAALVATTLPASAQTLFAADPADALIARGDSLQRLCRFDAALTAYEEALEALKDTTRRPQVQERIRMADNALSMMDVVATPRLVAKRRFPLDKFYLHVDVPAGAWRAVPNLLDSVMVHPIADVTYAPDGASRIWFSAADKSGARDIYYTWLADTLWTAPERLEAASSSEDEIFPIPSPDGNTVYFASEGHTGIGGFDLYSTTWDGAKRRWSKPVNLGFPYSSPADDFLLVQSPDGKYTIFASNRECSVDSVVVYVLEYEAMPVRKAVTEAQLRDLMVFRRPAETAVRKSTAPQTPEARYYRSLLKRRQAARKAISDSDATLEKLRQQYAAGDAARRQSLASEILAREDALPRLRDSLRAIERLMADAELDWARRGLPLEASTIEPEPEPAAAPVQKAYSFPQGRYGAPLALKMAPKADDESVFAVLPVGKFAADATLPKGVIYQIQCFSGSSHARVSELKGLSPVYERKTPNGSYAYFAGLFRHYKDAQTALKTVHKVGFKDAFIVAYRDGKSIRTSEAQKLEKK